MYDVAAAGGGGWLELKYQGKLGNGDDDIPPVNLACTSTSQRPLPLPCSVLAGFLYHIIMILVPQNATLISTLK
jgi:hypothetical protein